MSEEVVVGSPPTEKRREWCSNARPAGARGSTEHEAVVVSKQNNEKQKTRKHQLALLESMNTTHPQLRGSEEDTADGAHRGVTRRCEDDADVLRSEYEAPRTTCDECPGSKVERE